MLSLLRIVSECLRSFKVVMTCFSSVSLVPRCSCGCQLFELFQFFYVFRLSNCFYIVRCSSGRVKCFRSYFLFMELFKVVRVVQASQVEKVLTNCFLAAYVGKCSRLFLDPSSCVFHGGTML